MSTVAAWLWGAAGLLLAAGRLAGAEFDLRPSGESRLTLEVAKTGLLSGKVHRLEFPMFEGKAWLDEARPEASRVEFRVDVRRLEVRDDWLGEKDAKKVKEYALNEMLAAGQHPSVEFRSSAVTGSPGTGMKLTGTLTIRGVSRTVTGAVEPFDAGKPRFRGRFGIRMTDFGLKPPSAALGAIGTKPEMVLEFSVAGAVRPSP
jgi:polyisoprenoid-binding protein YceI